MCSVEEIQILYIYKSPFKLRQKVTPIQTEFCQADVRKLSANNEKQIEKITMWQKLVSKLDGSIKLTLSIYVWVQGALEKLGSKSSILKALKVVLYNFSEFYIGILGLSMYNNSIYFIIQILGILVLKQHFIVDGEQ